MIILYRKQTHFTATSPYLNEAVKRTLPVEHQLEDIQKICAEIDNYFTNQLPKDYSFDRWSEVQGYIPAANMMTAAAYLEIDSCAIGGFQSANIMQLLNQYNVKFNADQFDISLCLALGYRKHPQSNQVRWAKEDIITYI